MPKRPRPLLGLVALSVLLGAPRAQAAVSCVPTFEEARLIAPDAAPLAQCGHLCLAGDTLVVAAPGDPPGTSGVGNAYVWVRSGAGWALEQKLTVTDAGGSAEFGSASVSGDTIALGAWRDGEHGLMSGAVYVFVRSGGAWTLQQKLFASDAAVGAQLGCTVSVSGDTLVAGSYSAETAAGLEAGAAYVFTRTGGTWTETQKLTASDGEAFDWFGFSVAVSGDTILAGAPYDANAGGVNAGAGYLFARSGGTWTEVQKLVASDAATGDLFGMSAALSGTSAVLGAPQRATAAGPLAGAAYVYVRSGAAWIEEQLLTASAGAAGDRLGASVAIDGDLVAVGATRSVTVPESGKTLLFTRDAGAWSEAGVLVASDGSPGDWFGANVSVSAGSVAVGAPFRDPGGLSGAGEAYVFSCPATASLAVESGGDAFCLWPPNHRMHCIGASELHPLITGGCGSAPPAWRIAGCVSSQADDGTGDGDRPGDCVVSPDGQEACVRAERDGAISEGRTYTLAIEATDACGNVALGDVATVLVPHDRRPGASGCRTAAPAPRGPSLRDAGGGASPRFAAASLQALRAPVATAPSFGGCVPAFEEAQLIATDGQPLSALGRSISVSGDTIVAGAEHDALGGVAGAGAVYAWTRSGGTWALQQKLVAPDPVSPSFFGIAVSVSGDTVAIGACLDNERAAVAGAVYVFVRSGGLWTLQQKLTASDATIGSYFGWSVSLDGDTLVVGSYGHETVAGLEAGAAYVFTRSGGTWAEEQRLTASDGGMLDWFGYSAAVAGDTVLLGSPYHSHAGGVAAGAVYVFQRSAGAWAEQAKLTASDAADGDLFGYSVALSGDTAIAGAPWRASNTGAAYAFVRSGTSWSEQQVLSAAMPASEGRLGLFVAIDGDLAAAGAPGLHSATSLDPGRISLFTRTAGAWSEAAVLLASDGMPNDDFGGSVAVAGDIIAGGASSADPGGFDSAGKAYVFTCASTVPLTCAPSSGVPSCGTVALDAGVSAAGVAIAGATWSSADCPDAIITPDAGDPSLATALVEPACRTCTFDVTVTDSSGAACTGSVAVTFTDTTPPSIVSGGDAFCVWPPNHRMQCFDASELHPSITDDCGSPVTWRIVGCASSQPDDGLGDGDTAGDCEISPDGLQVCVRAERAGAIAEGRTYTIAIEATDACGNTARGDAATVLVPHDRSPGAAGCRTTARSVRAPGPAPIRAQRR